MFRTHLVDQLGSSQCFQRHNDGLKFRNQDRRAVDILKRRYINLQLRSDSTSQKRINPTCAKNPVQPFPALRKALWTRASLLTRAYCLLLTRWQVTPTHTPMINLSQTREASVSKMRCPGCKQSNVPPIQAMLKWIDLEVSKSRANVSSLNRSQSIHCIYPQWKSKNEPVE